MPKAEAPYQRTSIDCYDIRHSQLHLRSVAATKTPIIFLGVGEHLHDLDRFSPQPFISKLLGLGDVQGLMEHMQDLATQNPDKQKEMAKKLEEGKLSIRDWREQIQNVMNMYKFHLFDGWPYSYIGSRGPISKIASMIPGLPQDISAGGDEEGALRMKRMIFITDSMTAEELDSDGTLFMETGKDGKPVDLTWRVTRVARGSGTSVREVEELLCQYQMMANMAKQAGGKNGWYCPSRYIDQEAFKLIGITRILGCRRCRKCRPLPAERGVALMEHQLRHKYKPCRSGQEVISLIQIY